MNFIEIYNKTLQYWPENIDISDGKLIKETNGFYSNNLSITWSKAEELAATNKWTSLMVWVIYKAIHRKATELFPEKRFISVNSMDIFVIEKSYLEALQEDGYEEMLSEYIKQGNNSH